jgi:hypothetical protein
MESRAEVKTMQSGCTRAKEGLGEDEGRILTVVVTPKIEMRIVGFVPRAQGKARKKRHRPVKRCQRPDHVHRVAFQMKILDTRRVRKDLFDRLAGQSHQRRFPNRTAFLLGRRGAHAKPTPLLRFLGRRNRGRGRSDVDIDVFGDMRRSL